MAEQCVPPAIEYMYPSNLADSKSNFIRITANKYQYGGGGSSIASVSLYHPSQVTFQDGAGYSTMDLGPIGSTIIAGINSGRSAESIALEANRNVMDTGNSTSGDLRNLISLKIAKDAGLTSLVPGVENLQAVYGAAKGVAVNPNTVSSFQNMNIRTYQFNFKMVAKDPDESNDIRKIQSFFREHMYPEEGAGSYILTYPATFRIQFYTSEGRENPYYPKIYETFLTNFSTNFNSSSHLHYAGGAPIEVDISLTFQETKVLTKADLGEGYL